MKLSEFVKLVLNQVRKHGSHGGAVTIEEAVNDLTPWELLCLIKDKDPDSFEEELEELYK